MSRRINYWSCSKFADWLRGTGKIKFGTSKEWRLWREAAKNYHPTRYWLAEEGLDIVQDVLYWPRDRLDDIRYYVNNRWITRSHALTAHPQHIKPGQWCDLGNRFLPCLFNELVDFVEIEQAWHHCMWDINTRKRYHVPWWRRSWPNLRTWRCPDAGIEHLIWASGLRMDENMGFNKGDEGYGEPSTQAKAAEEILKLYRWWKEVYPNRPEPHDASGWTLYCDLRRKKGYDLFNHDDETPEEQEMCAVALKKNQEIEAAYQKEDEEMMIRLIRVRESLWT